MQERNLHWLPLIHAPTGPEPRRVPQTGTAPDPFGSLDHTPTNQATLARAQAPFNPYGKASVESHVKRFIYSSLNVFKK